MAEKRGNPDKLNPPIRSTREAREKGSAGGKKSGEVRREKRKLRELLEMMLQQPVEAGDGSTNAEAMTVALLKKALSGDTRAYEIIRDTIGEKPVEKRDVAMQAELALTNEQRAAVYRLALQAAMGGEGEDDLK